MMNTYLNDGLATALGTLLLCSFFKLLLYAFRYTQDAGLTRLEDKYPEMSGKIAKWSARWPLLLGGMALLALAAHMASILLFWQAIRWQLSPLLFRIIAVVLYGLMVYGLTSTLPRVIAGAYADRLTRHFLGAAGSLAFLLFPIIGPINKWEQFLSETFLSHAGEEHRPTSEEEIMSLVEQADEKRLEEEEREIIRSVFEFGDTVVREIMTPRVEIEGVEDTETIGDSIAVINQSKYSRLPIFHEGLDDVRGVVHVKDVLKLSNEKKDSENVLTAAKQATFVPESMPINDLLKLFRRERVQLAVVVDEYGGTAGLVSLEDVLEELVGEIEDEHDEEEYNFQQLSDGSYLFDAKTPVDEVNDEVGISVPESEEYDSLGGYIFSALGRIPEPGEVVHNGSYELIVQTATARKIDTVRIKLHRETE